MRFLILIVTLVLVGSALAQEKPAPTIPFAQILKCVQAADCRNMTPGPISAWSDAVGFRGVAFIEAGWKYELFITGPGRDDLSIQMMAPGETRSSHLVTLDKRGELVEASLKGDGGPSRGPVTPEVLAARQQARKAFVAAPRWPRGGTLGEEFKPFWQKLADQALAAIRRQMWRPDSMSVLDYMAPPNTLHEMLARTPIVIVGQVVSVGDPRVGAGEQSVYREVALQVREVLRDKDRALVGRQSVVITQYGGMAEADGKLRATAEVLTPRSLQKSDWVLLFLSARPDGRLNFFFGGEGVIWLGEPGRDSTVTLPWSFSQMTHLARTQISQGELLDILRKTSAQLGDAQTKPEVPVSAIIACAGAMNCKNMKSSSLNWFDQVGIPVLAFNDASGGYAIRTSRDGGLSIWITEAGQGRPSQLVTLRENGEVWSGELGPQPGERGPSRMTPEEFAKWQQVHKVFTSRDRRPPDWKGYTEEFLPFWQEQAAKALAAIRRTIGK